MTSKKTKKENIAKLSKVTFQAHYKPELKFYDLLYSTAQKFKEFPHWNTDRLSVILRDYSKRCSLGIKHFNFSYDQDSNSITDEECNLKKALEMIPECLEIKSYIRIGYRRKYLISTNMSFHELVKIINIKFFNQDEKLIKIMPQEIYDLQYVIDSLDDKYRFHIRIGPVQKEEIPKHLQFNRENHIDPNTAQKDYEEIIRAYPDVAIFVDLDMFQKNDEIPTSEAPLFLEVARPRLKKMVAGIQHYIFGI